MTLNPQEGSFNIQGNGPILIPTFSNGGYQGEKNAKDGHTYSLHSINHADNQNEV